MGGNVNGDGLFSWKKTNLWMMNLLVEILVVNSHLTLRGFPYERLYISIGGFYIYIDR